MELRVAQHVACTESEGPGRRFALWVAGCSLRCPGCCNPELFEGRHVAPRSVEPTVEAIAAATDAYDIEGITVLGGEPLDQIEGVATLGRAVKGMGLGVIVFTGYTLAEARQRPGFASLWRSLDTLVDGRYDPHRPEPPRGRMVVGSTNQRLHHASPRYADPQRWQGPRSAELQVAPDGTVTAVGTPREVARLLKLVAAPSR